ncbi:MAG: hypothetical protein H0W72_17760 [Planctomycetes bacterium]|nr:hypothetical protein [Planctomycetota bacterium]
MQRRTLRDAPTVSPEASAFVRCMLLALPAGLALWSAAAWAIIALVR